MHEGEDILQDEDSNINFYNADQSSYIAFQSAQRNDQSGRKFYRVIEVSILYSIFHYICFILTR